MSDKDLTGKDLAKNLTTSKAAAADIAKSAKKIEDSLKAAARATTGAFGGGIRATFNQMTGTRQYGVTGGIPGPATFDNSLMRPGLGLSDFTNFASGMSKGFSNFLPDVSSAVQRAGNYYNATIMGGFRGSQKLSSNNVDDRTFGVLSSMGGVTSAGSSAEVANIFANQGMVAGSEAYMRNVRAVGNAARYLNMDNATAAKAIGGLGTGASSSNLMRNFGIYTTDPTTGKERSMSDIFGDLASRLSGVNGANATPEDVQNSIRKGALGASIANSGLTDTQQTLFKQYMIERAQGNNMDLSNQSTMDKLNSSVDNPMNSFMNLETSGEGAQKNATGAYLDGIKAVTGTLTGLDAVAGRLASVLGGVTSGMQVLMGAKTTQGLMGMAGSSINLISSGIEAMMQADPTHLSELFSGMAGVATGGVGLAATENTANAGFRAGIFGGSGATGEGGQYKNSKTGSTSKTGGGDNSTPFGGLDQGGYTITTGTNTVGQPLAGKLPTGGWQFTTKEPSGNHKGQQHKAIDYPAPKGTAVMAVADGEVEEFFDGVKKDSTIDKNGNPNWHGVGDGKGNYVKLNHGIGKNGKNIYTIYEHLGSVTVKKSRKKDGAGDQVKRGDVIGYVGLTGDTSGAHLHYEVNEGATKVDPKNLSSLLGNSTTTGKISKAQASAASSLVNAVMSAYAGDPGAIQALMNATGVSATMSKYGVSGNSTSPANQYANAGDTGATGGGAGGGSNVTNNVGGITVNIKDASPESAQKFAQIVQDYLNNQTLTSNLGSY